MRKTQSIDRFEDLVAPVPLCIDPEDIPDILDTESRCSLESLPCLYIMEDTPSDPLEADTIIVPEVAIFEPYKSTLIEIRNIGKSYLTVSDTRVFEYLSYLFIMSISDDK